MKKRFVALLAAVMVCAAPLAVHAEAVDLSGMSFDELLDLQTKVTQALWASDGWQEVEVPVGVYQVGDEIPAGRWTISKARDEFTYFRVGNKFEDGEVGGYTFTSDLETDLNVIIEDGQYIEVSEFPVIFKPYVTSFTFK